MSDAININQTSVKNPFGAFKSTPNRYYFATQNLPQSSDSFQYEKTKDEKETKKLGKTIALSALGVGAGILFLMRGLPKNTYKNLEKWAQKLEEKLYKQRKNGQVGRLEEFYTFTLNKMVSFMEKTKSINNFVSIKDISFEKLMSKTKVTKKIHSKITKVYENIGRRTVNKAYDKAKTKMYNTFQIFEDYDDKILRKTNNGQDVIDGKTVNEWLDAIEDYKTQIRRTWNSKCGQRARDERFNIIKEDVKNLSDEVWEATAGNVDNLKKRELYETFIAEEMLAGKKLKLINDVKQSRFAITRDIDDIYDSTIDVLSNITSFVRGKDNTSRELIKDLRLKLSEWKKLAGPHEKQSRIKINDEISALLNKLSKNINDNKRTFNYDTNTVTQMTSNIQNITRIMGEDGKGAMQEIFTIYKKLLPREEYLQLKATSQKNLKYVDDAINKETDSFFDMMRDLKLGSAPTDILSILAAVGAIGVGLSKAENKDQQNTVLLKAGIPALGAIATSLYFSASLVSGGKAMLLGGLSGLAISKGGSMLDDYRKKHFPVNEQPAKPQN